MRAEEGSDHWRRVPIVGNTEVYREALEPLARDPETGFEETSTMSPNGTSWAFGW
jgi:hypothetical protein